jgi:hypothetical protein
MDKKKDQHDKAVEDSFPASDPPAATGITGPRVSTPKTKELDHRDEQQKNEGQPRTQDDAERADVTRCHANSPKIAVAPASPLAHHYSRRVARRLGAPPFRGFRRRLTGTASP